MTDMQPVRFPCKILPDDACAGSAAGNLSASAGRIVHAAGESARGAPDARSMAGDGRTDHPLCCRVSSARDHAPEPGIAWTSRGGFARGATGHRLAWPHRSGCLRRQRAKHHGLSPPRLLFRCLGGRRVGLRHSAQRSNRSPGARICRESSRSASPVAKRLAAALGSTTSGWWLTPTALSASSWPDPWAQNRAWECWRTSRCRSMKYCRWWWPCFGSFMRKATARTVPAHDCAIFGKRLGDDAFLGRVDQLLQEEKRQAHWPAPTMRRVETATPLRERLGLPLGDVAPDMRRGTCRSRQDCRVEKCGSGCATTCSFSPNPMLSLSPRLAVLRSTGFVVACPGATWCTRGLVDTRAAAGRIRPALPSDCGLLMGISGCPNNCPQASTADIGLIGRFLRVGDDRIEAFRLVAGGGKGETPALAVELHPAVPAASVHEAVAWLVEEHQRRQNGSATYFADFVAGFGNELRGELSRRYGGEETTDMTVLMQKRKAACRPKFHRILAAGDSCRRLALSRCRRRPRGHTEIRNLVVRRCEGHRTIAGDFTASRDLCGSRPDRMAADAVCPRAVEWLSLRGCGHRRSPVEQANWP